jgi:RNA polymerase sigma-70 factor (ECF subfamily)
MNGPDKPEGATPVSLLEQVKAGDADGWRRMQGLYAPLLFWWAHRRGLGEQDAEEVTQEVFLTVFRRVKEFTPRQPQGSFRAWLKGIMHHKIGDHIRQARKEPAVRGDGQERLAQLAAPADEDDPDASAEEAILLHRAMDLVRAEFEPATWDAAYDVLVGGKSAAVVAAERGRTANAVYVAKSRVLGRLKEELQGLLDLPLGRTHP